MTVTEDPAPAFRGFPVALLRVATRPEAAAGADGPDLDPDDPAQAERVRDHVRRLAADPVLREAVAVASPSLARAVERILAGGGEEAAVRRAAYALTRYALRAASRPTPFGLFAGVALARTGRPAKVRRGDRHRRAVRPDREWLVGVVRQLEADPAVRRGLRLVRNDLCAERGDRLALPYVPTQGPDAERRQTSVRNTPAVRAALAAARTPVPYDAVAGSVRAAVPGATGPAVDDLLGRLVEQSILLTDLLPGLDGADPLGHVLARLPAGSVHRDELAAVAAAITDHAGADIAGGPAAWAAADARMRRVHDSGGTTLQVDLLADVEVQLPDPVVGELAAAAELLGRIAAAMPDGSDRPGRQYHDEFRERYGDRAVPLRELLDPQRGLGPPAGYLMPPHRQPDHAGDPGPQPDWWTDLVGHAMATGGEVVLDGLADRLDPAPPGELPVAVELYAELHASDCDAVETGDFRLVLTGSSRRAGGTFGRFAAALGPDAVDAVAAVVAGSAGAVGTPAEVRFEPARSHGANVAHAPRLTSHRVALGVLADRDDPGVDGLDDLAVYADAGHLRVWSSSLGQELTPLVPTMLNTYTYAPNAARLLAELGDARRGPWGPWSWGPLDGLPYLPQVRFRRTVVSRARWRPPAGLRSASTGWEAWRAELAGWRQRWRVPDLVELVENDNRLRLDLRRTLHLRLLRRELAREVPAVLREVLPGARFGWLDGHNHEIVVPLVARPAPPAPRRAVRTGAGAVPLHPPGGEWVYAKLYAAGDLHDELLAAHLPVLLRDLPGTVDRWFFVRYRDPEPHLRVRVHGGTAALLPRLHDWAADLVRAGLLSRLVLDSYEPELHRYGGPDAMAAAEHAFCADSVAAVEQLRLHRRGPAPAGPALLLAANYVDLLRALGGADWADWVLAAHSRDEEDHRHFRLRRREALALVPGLGDDWRPPDGELAGCWSRRHAAVARYGRAVRVLERDGRSWAPLAGIRGSMLHMTHNRVAGIDPEAERLSLACLRGIVEAHRGRTAHAR